MTGTGNLVVHCSECGHEWTAAHCPMDLNKFVRLVRNTHCPMCGATPKNVKMGPHPSKETA